MASPTKKYSTIPFFFGAGNILLAAAMIWHGINFWGSLFVLAFPCFALYIIHSFLKDGYYEIGYKGGTVDGQKTVSVKKHPRNFWTGIGFIFLWYSGITGIQILSLFSKPS